MSLCDVTRFSLFTEADALPESFTPPTGDEVKSLFQELRALNALRNGDYQAARSLYKGKHWDGLGLKAQKGRYTLVANYIRPTVDSAVSDLVGRMPGIQVVPRSAEQDERERVEGEEALVYQTWNENDAAFVFRRVAHNMFLCRRGLISVWWDPKAEKVCFASIVPDNYYPLVDGGKTVECIVASRRLTRSLKLENPSLASKISADLDADAAVLAPGVALTAGGIMDALGDAGGSSRTAEGYSAGYTTVLDWYDVDGHWVRVMGDAVHSQTLGYKFGHVPVIEFPYNLPGDEGEPDTASDGILDLNQYLDQLYSQQADIIKKYANPTVIDKGSGQAAKDVQRIVQEEGGVLPCRPTGDLTFLNWAGPQPAIHAQADRIQGFIYDLSGRPASSYGQSITNQSGVATNMALSPITAATNERQTIFSVGLRKLNICILKLFENFESGKSMKFQGSKPVRPGLNRTVFFGAELTGKDVDGWYENRIKWPSQLRTDDPVYVQQELAKMKGDASNPPAQSLYTTLENLNIDDVEAEIDRVKAQLEDPRLHPDRMAAAVSAAQAFSSGPQLPPDLQGLDGQGVTGAPVGAPSMPPTPAGLPDVSGLLGGPKGGRQPVQPPPAGLPNANAMIAALGSAGNPNRNKVAASNKRKS